MDLTEEELRGWLTLIRAPGLGPRRAKALLDVFGSPSACLDAGPARWKQVITLPAQTEAALRRPDRVGIDKDLHWLDADGHFFIPIGATQYPALLAEIYDPPIGLFAQGRTELMQQAQLAVVGSRNPDYYGENLALALAAEMCQCGITITSGMALGIDAAAHRGALAAGGDTIAVVATGLDQVYPKLHEKLASEIRQSGCIVSEQPTQTQPKAGLFPRRNRIISGLSLGTVVVQAAMQSGSLITARLAMEQGREVFAIPGSIHNPLSKGCHRLIRQGAIIAETRDDILMELSAGLKQNLNDQERFTAGANSGIMKTVEPEMGSEADHQNTGHPSAPESLLQLLNEEPCSIDLLVERTHLSSEVVSSMLIELEIGGHVSSHAGRFYRITPKESL